jgi:NAD+ diphosphatase
VSPPPNAFAASPLDRAAHLRRDAQWLAAALRAPQTRLVAIGAAKPLMREGGVLWLTPDQAPPGSSTVFLGVDHAGAAVFAVAAREAPEGGEFTELRAAAATLSSDDIAILGCAKSLLEWHGRHPFCAACGVATASAEAGWKRVCPACAAEHFPRVDPVVIMLASRGEYCLLGRQARFAPRVYSALAGYVEPGESAEEACARELMEEAGVVATRIRYHSTQPWPFPSSLMIGLLAEVESEALTIDYTELEDARWFSRAETRTILEGRHESVRCPPPLAIAHHLIAAWAFS